MRRLIAVLPFGVALLLCGCESTGDSSNVSGGVYYGAGLYDPWYYGGYYDDVDIIVNPPDRPEAPLRPEHPIARPPPASVSARPLPSMPSTPRPALRR